MEQHSFLTWDGHRALNLCRPGRQDSQTGLSPAGQSRSRGQKHERSSRSPALHAQGETPRRVEGTGVWAVQPGPVLRARSASAKGTRDRQPLGRKALPVRSPEHRWPGPRRPRGRRFASALPGRALLSVQHEAAGLPPASDTRGSTRLPGKPAQPRLHLEARGLVEGSKQRSFCCLGSLGGGAGVLHHDFKRKLSFFPKVYC